MRRNCGTSDLPPTNYTCHLCGQGMRHFSMGQHERYFRLMVAAMGWTSETLKEAIAAEDQRGREWKAKLGRIKAEAAVAGGREE